MWEAWRKIAIKDTKFSVFLHFVFVFCFLFFARVAFDFFCVALSMRALRLIAKFCKVMKVMLDIKVIKKA